MNKIISKPELLAPAGDLEKLKIALLYGADAVYVGGTAYSLRANATNFTMNDLQEGVAYAHGLGKKVYVTVNIVLHDKELGNLITYLQQLEKIGVDAIIVSDPAIISLTQQHTNLTIHLSTQQSTLNKEAASFWKNIGVERIVLAREASKEDIQDIRKNVEVELECFIHGAMCASYSGRCVLSNFLTARDSNRGGCAQICRWDFDLKDEFGNVLQGEKPFTFCTKDLSLANHIPELIDLGVTSFKIEGRMRSVYYIATIVDIYRKIIDAYCSNPQNYTYNKDYERILRNCANRDSITQFFNDKNDEECQYYNGREEVSNQDFLGIVLDYDEETKEVTLEQRNYFKVGDKVEFFGPNISCISFTIEKIYDLEGNLIDIVRHPRQIVKMKIPFILYKNDMMRIKR